MTTIAEKLQGLAYFTDLNGQPLQMGNIYVGAPNMDPRQNPITVYYDSAAQNAAVQPLRTLNGYTTRAGAITEIFVPQVPYSLYVENCRGEEVYYSQSVMDPATAFIATQTLYTVASIAALRLVSKATYSLVNVASYYAGSVSTGGGGRYYLDASDTTSADNNGTVIVATDGGRWKYAPGQAVDLRTFGAYSDGTHDDTTACNNAVAAYPANTRVEMNISGPTKVSGNVTFNPGTTLVAKPGIGYFVGVAGTEQVYAQRQISAGAELLFSNCVGKTSVPQFSYPEWFGASTSATDTVNTAAFQAASTFLQNTGGTIQAGFGTYQLASNFNIGNATAGATGSNIRFKGRGETRTTLQLTGAAQGCIQVLGLGGTALQGVELVDFNITKSVAQTGGVGIYAQYTALMRMRNVHVSGMLQGFGLLGAGNTLCDDLLVNINSTANNQVGFNLDGGGTQAGGSASSYFNRCFVDGSQATGTGHIGFKAYGTYTSDLAFSFCETSQVPYGYSWDMTTTVNTGNEDVQLINCRADGPSSAALIVSGAGTAGSANAMFNVIGGWYHSQYAVDLIQLTNSQGVVISGAQIYSGNGAATTGVKMTNCAGCSVLGNTFRDVLKAVSANGGRTNAVRNNNIYNSSTHPATQQITVIGEAYSSFDGNTFRGYSTLNAVAVDSTSTSCSVSGNNADPANIGAPRFSNTSTGTPFTVNNIGA